MKTKKFATKLIESDRGYYLASQVVKGNRLFAWFDATGYQIRESDAKEFEYLSTYSDLHVVHVWIERVFDADDLPAFTLQSGCHDGRGETVVVTYRDLKKAVVGAEWAADCTRSGRDRTCERLTLIEFSNDDRFAYVRIDVYGTTDHLDPKKWTGNTVFRRVEL